MSLRVSLAFVLALALPTLAHADDAADVFQAKHGAILELVEQNASDAKLGKQLDAMIDYHALAEASLGGADNYAKVCGKRCAEFEALLTQLVRESYLRMVRKANQYPVEYVGAVEGKGGAHKITTKMVVEKNGRQRKITVEYVLHQVGGAWQIRDIITDDVSLVKTYRHDFHKIAKQDGIDGVIERLEQRLAGASDVEGFVGNDGT